MIPVSGRDGERWKSLLSGGVDGLDELFALAKAAARGLAMLSCFVLRQDSAQARFVWHQDNNFPHVKLTIVYLLTIGSSTMRVAGFDSFVYESQGCGVAFPSAAHHRSGGCSHPGTMKVTFFFGEEADPEVLLYTRQVMRSQGGGNVTGSELWRDRDWDR
uniref:Fe2OG dioxygenase domain-containing protein n=1 Tax=Haptolina brevifila TaxID=156173 RepID=A0A7S2MFE2_9EUKA